MIGLLGMGAMAASAIVGTSVAWSTVSDWMSDGNQGQDLARAAVVTGEKANDLNLAFVDVAPVRVHDISEEISPGFDKDFQMNFTDDPVDNEVASAFETLAVIDAGVVPGANDTPVQARAVAMKNLQAAWGPRYKQVQHEYQVFKLRIEHADKTAGEYFKYQRELTEKLHNAEDRLRSRSNDSADLDLYREWRVQAIETYERAGIIMLDLDDMDILITKQALSANFAVTYMNAQQVPSGIEEFHRELGQFRTKLDEINAEFHTDSSTLTN